MTHAIPAPGYAVTAPHLRVCDACGATYDPRRDGINMIGAQTVCDLCFLAHFDETIARSEQRANGGQP